MRTSWLRAAALAAAAALALPLATATPALAYEPVEIVHTEQVQVGPYPVTVGFSEWPLRGLHSLDFTFMPEGGIADRSGTVELMPDADPSSGETEPLSRHPRKREVWGLDVYALDDPGPWTLRFSVDGPLGRGEGVLPRLSVLEQPGPPMALSWSMSVIPMIMGVLFLVVVWRRSRPGDRIGTAFAT
ncbi:hypothetical protein JOF41_002375 [Saccharothrix coeruleofusca]|uniref:hypothetical protein n=1 Tax=Saccharothrix coeruleofusca TaxID=33919 RepID=UPI001FCFF0C5|nr:hypothetical protein [Saccharothrix coeruleofusca]MBP2336197.1 hypothetical protein [Saccharothrix coeruleofusca]